MLLAANFARQFDRRFSRIFDLEYKAQPSMRDLLYDMPATRKGPDEKTATEGELDDYNEFTGTVTYGDIFQGYEVTATHRAFTKGMIIQRQLIDDALFSQMEDKPKKMARAAVRTKERHAARLFTMAFSNDNFFYTHSEGVPLCSNSHTTTSGASTATGFDNLATAALSATAVASNRIQMRNFRGDRGQIIGMTPTALWIPTNLYETAYEIVSSLGKVDVATNNANVHYGQYNIYEWQYMTDSTDWFMTDESETKANLKWYDRIPIEFSNVEDFDTFHRKWRSYMRYSYKWIDWRWIMGNQVA